MRYAVLGILLLAGCGGSDSAAPNEDAEVSGRWNFNETMSSNPLSYVGSGTITLSGTAQFSGSLSEQAVVTGPGGALEIPMTTVSIQGGQVDGRRVSFQAGTCDYQGTASGNPTNRLDGSVSCDLDIGGQPFRFTGSWQAGK